MTTTYDPVDARPRQRDHELRDRARKVIPGGMYGHQNATRLPAGFPQFMAAGEGCRVRDVDGNEYVDFMCSYGPIVLGHRHPAVEAAARAQLDQADCQNGPGEVIVELAERFVDVVDHADWAMFAKNGTDATTTCVTVARAQTEKRKVLVAEGAYHGAAPWCTPAPAGVVPEDRAHLLHYRFNDLESVTKAVESAGDDVAAIVVSPFKHDARHDQELVDPAFANGLRAICDDTGAALILDDVRCGFRLAHGGSWEPLGVAARPVGVEQGDRQRVPAGRRHRQRPLPRRRRTDLRHRVVLVLGCRDGCFGGDDRRPRRRGRGGPDGAHRATAARRAGGPGRRPRRRRSARPGRCRCRCMTFAGRRGLRRWPASGATSPPATAPTSTPGTTGSCRPPTPTPTSTRRSPPPTPPSPRWLRPGKGLARRPPAADPATVRRRRFGRGLPSKSAICRDQGGAPPG